MSVLNVGMTANITKGGKATQRLGAEEIVPMTALLVPHHEHPQSGDRHRARDAEAYSPYHSSRGHYLFE
jgi:hypothetical protein